LQPRRLPAVVPAVIPAVIFEPRRLGITLLLLLLLTIACNDEQSPPIAITSHSESANLTLKEDADGKLSLHIRSSDGFGFASVKLDRKSCESGFEAVLHLSALEGFSVVTTNERHRLGVNTSGDVLVEPASSRALHMSELSAMKSDGKYGVVVSPGFFAEPVCEFRLEWVDYYR